MTDPLWAPWRLEYVSSANEQTGCIFCHAAAAPDDADSLVVHRSESALVMLNRFPYSSGHLLVAPIRHVGDLGELSAQEAAEIHSLSVRALEVLSALFQPDGFNIGWNLGRNAGAGVVDHVHEHVVPRWQGDTNFMPVLADVRVIPEHLQTTHARIKTAWSE
ncbi:MAG TPA: HIT domain-containing protein [Gaiellaceae bacterium]|jgi:ATP adenylyltransferase